ncbi:MAG: hypothetical protein NZM44_01510 [Candidatus Calescibacterium sp.]|nr:hypothetical protein [Candidatus Calescibacterium sp.]
MEKLMKEDFEKLNNDFIYVAKRKFNVDLDNSVTGVYISDVLISLYFEGKRNTSKIAISLVGSFIGQTIMYHWGGSWVPDSFSIKYVGNNKITVNPFSMAHQRLTKGVNKTLFDQLEMVAIKANNDNIKMMIDDDRVGNIFNRLFDEGWWPLSMVYKKNLPNYVRYEMAYILGVIAKYVKDKDYIKQKFGELLSDRDTVYYACVAFQNCLFPEFVDKIFEIIYSNDYSNTVKAQAISSLEGRSRSDDDKVMNFAHSLLFKLDNPVLKFYIGNLLGTFDNQENIEWINQKLKDDNLDEFSKLALLVAVQLLRKKEFNNTLLSIFLNGSVQASIKDEIIKTLHLLPINDEIYHLRNEYDKFDMKNKIGFINIVLFSDFKDKKRVLLDLLSNEHDSFVKSYILSAIDNIGEDDKYSLQ